MRKLRVGMVLGIGLTLLLGGLALAQLFGMGNYPGGHLKTVYRITSKESPNPAQFTLEITPQPDGNYKVVSITEAVEAPDQIELGIFSLFFLGYSFRAESDKIDLMPLTALNERAVEPHKTYVLEGGARLITQDEAEIAGVPVIMGIYIHPDYPDQRVVIALPEVEMRKLLPLPPLLRVEQVAGGGQWEPLDTIELMEFVHD